MNGDKYGEGGPAGAEKINVDIVTLTRFLTEEQVKHKEATGDFTYGTALRTSDVQPADLLLPDYYAMPSNSPSNQSPTTSAEPP